METVTGFSASLLQSLDGDTKKSAKLADVAISDMADNANKMGTSMESIQFAYQGFAKQNYTMLDNLKLGYGGTKTEMERLVKDAAKLDKSIDASSMSYANIIKAIHAVQKKMDITGTTAKEAEKTISGSLSSMKSAWGNLLPALIKGGDSFDQCVDNLVSSVKTFAGNVMPAIKKGLSGVGSLIEKLSPMIANEIPSLVDDLLPPLIKAATSIVQGLIKALPNIVGALVKEIPNIIKTIGQTILDTFGTQFPIVKKFGEFFNNISNFCKENTDTIKKFIPVLLGLPVAFKAIKLIGPLLSSLGGLFGKSSKSKKGGFFDGITNSLKTLGKTKTSIILKGMANLAIIAGGFTIISSICIIIMSLMSQITDAGAMLKMIAVIGALGVVSAALAKLAGIVGKIPVSTVAKGLANMAIVLAGMTILFVLIGAASFINFDLKKILQITAIIGVLGTVGAILTVFAGIVGLIPIPVVLMGLANIALVLAGLTALVVAFGVLSEIKGFNDFIKKGGETLATLFNVLGKVVGSLIGGIGEGITNSLPKIGENLSNFAKSLEPFFSMFKNVDLSGIGNFLGTLGAFLLTMSANNILTFFTGSIAGVGTQLTDFAINSKEFFTTVAKLPAAGFGNAKLLFQSLSDIGNVPKSGGLMQWFTGTTDFKLLASGLAQLSSKNVIKFYNTIKSLPKEVFENTTAFFKSLSDIGNVPQSGGLMQWFSGTIDFDLLASGLAKLSSEKVIKFYNTISALPKEVFQNITAFFKSLSDIGNVPQTGGLMQWFSGTIDFDLLASGLSKLSGTGVIKFYKAMADFPKEGAENAAILFDSFGKLPKSGGIGEFFSGSIDFDKLASGMGKLANESVIKFCRTMSILPKEGFENAKILFQALSEIGNIPKSGGMGDFFSGSVDFDELASGLGKLSGKRVANFFKTMATIPTNGFANAKALFKCLAEIDVLPKDGGIGDFFSGSVDYDKLSAGLSKLSGDSVVGFFNTVANLPTNAFANAKALFESLAGIGNLPAENGVFQLFTGDINLGNLGIQLKQFGDSAESFFTQVNDLNISNLNGLWNSLKTAEEISGNGLSTINTNIDNVVNKISKLPVAFLNAGNRIKSIMRNTMSSIISIVSSVNLYNAGYNIMLGLNNGLLNAKGHILNTANSIANSISTTINKALDIHSPSRVTEDSGFNVGMGSVVGMKKALPKIKNEAENIGYAISYGVDDPINDYSPENSITNTKTTNNEYNTYSPQFTLNMNGTTDRSTERRVKQWIKEALTESYSSIGRSNAELQEV